jgi:5'-nucleotidase
MRIMVTNDDGIDSVGLHVLAKALVPLGEVIVVAPDTEYSGAGASLGALHLIRPEVHRLSPDSFPTMSGVAEIWSVTGPPALCVMFARLSVFGPKPDIVVSGINPGANVGRAVYHSGTVGAALTARSGGITGVAISQDVASGSFDGQGLEEMLSKQQWQSAADVGVEVVRTLIESPPDTPVVYNVNVPNCPVSEMLGWRSTEVGTVPPRTMGSATLEPKPGHEGAFRVSMVWGEALQLPEHLDGGAVTAGWVSVSTLSTIKADHGHAPVDNTLDRYFTSKS